MWKDQIPESLKMQDRARRRIPGISQLLSKRPQQFAPGLWPGYFTRASGAETWDLDGNKYLDMSISGIGANVLGFADPDVNAAVQDAVSRGNMCSLNSPEEVELAELLCELHPWSAMVRFARTGGEAMSIAVRLARSHTGRDKVAFCGYHGWHDWYLAANLTGTDKLEDHLLPGLNPSGVPRGLAGTALPFDYNDTAKLRKILEDNRGQIAAIVMEPVRSHFPKAGYLEEVRALATEHGVVLIFDEITAGFRLLSGASHLAYQINPDIAVFAKAISNGYPMAAILGRENVMQAAQESFVSSTYWTERVGPVAALATIRKHRANDVAKHLIRVGEKVQAGWTEAAKQAGVAIHVHGIAPLSHFGFESAGGPQQAQAMITLYTQLMLKKGFLAGGRFYSTYAHTDAHVDAYLKSTLEAFREIASLEASGKVLESLEGEIAHSGFRRLT